MIKLYIKDLNLSSSVLCPPLAVCRSLYGHPVPNVSGNCFKALRGYLRAQYSKPIRIVKLSWALLGDEWLVIWISFKATASRFFS